MELKGDAPKIFMSFAESHCVGGEGGSDEVSGVVGEPGRLSHEKGDAGGGDRLGLSLRVMFKGLQRRGLLVADIFSMEVRVDIA